MKKEKWGLLEQLLYGRKYASENIVDRLDEVTIKRRGKSFTPDQRGSWEKLQDLENKIDRTSQQYVMGPVKPVAPLKFKTGHKMKTPVLSDPEGPIRSRVSRQVRKDRIAAGAYLDFVFEQLMKDKL